MISGGRNGRGVRATQLSNDDPPVLEVNDNIVVSRYALANVRLWLSLGSLSGFPGGEFFLNRGESRARSSRSVSRLKGPLELGAGPSTSTALGGNGLGGPSTSTALGGDGKGERSTSNAVDGYALADLGPEALLEIRESAAGWLGVLVRQPLTEPGRGSSESSEVDGVGDGWSFLRATRGPPESSLNAARPHRCPGHPHLRDSRNRLLFAFRKSWTHATNEVCRPAPAGPR
jgi:hypothetical protein